MFEERVVAFRAETDKAALEKAKRESEAYSTERQDRKYDVHPEQVAYCLDENELADGCEVWSEMFESGDTLNEFYNSRYSKYEYHPE